MNSPSVKRHYIPKLAVRLVKENNIITTAPKIIHQPSDTIPILKPLFDELTVEHFVAILLNTKHHVLAVSTISCGSLNTSIVHPRELFRVAMLQAGTTASLIIAHNHPSNDPTPSQEDIALTKKLVEGGKLLDIPILDHIIYCQNNYTSLKEHGII